MLSAKQKLILAYYLLYRRRRRQLHNSSSSDTDDASEQEDELAEDAPGSSQDLPPVKLEYSDEEFHSEELNLGTSFNCTECYSSSFGPIVTCVQCSDFTMCLKCDREGRHQFHCLLKMPTKQYMDTVKDYLSKVREKFARLLTNFKDDEEKQKKTELLKKTKAATEKRKARKAEAKQIPTARQQLPTKMQQIPTTVQQIPTTSQQLPTTRQQIPTTSQQLPTTRQQLPIRQIQTIQQIPITGQQIPTTTKQKQQAPICNSPYLRVTSEGPKLPVINQQHLLMNQQQPVTNQPKMLMLGPTASPQGTVFVIQPTSSSNVAFQTLGTPQVNVPVQRPGVISTSTPSTAAYTAGDPLALPAKRTADDVECKKRLAVDNVKVEVKEEDMYEVEIHDEPLMVVRDVKTEPPEEVTAGNDPGASTREDIFM